MGQLHSIAAKPGSRLTLTDLPHRGSMYWTDRQKADVVTAVRSGLITFAQASEWYMLSAEEFITWLKLDRPGRISKAVVHDEQDKLLHRQERIRDIDRPLHVVAH
jgi:Protein of unknown function (DUF1153)